MTGLVDKAAVDEAKMDEEVDETAAVEAGDEGVVNELDEPIKVN